MWQLCLSKSIGSYKSTLGAAEFMRFSNQIAEVVTFERDAPVLSIQNTPKTFIVNSQDNSNFNGQKAEWIAYQIAPEIPVKSVEISTEMVLTVCFETSKEIPFLVAAENGKARKLNTVKTQDGFIVIERLHTTSSQTRVLDITLPGRVEIVAKVSTC
jgi:hypothetical protein